MFQELSTSISKVVIKFSIWCKPDISDMPIRRYDLDWLRILAFGLLIFYHSGMFYVEGWGWHAKSQYQSSFLANIMLMVEPWRMPILWLISGIALRFVVAKVSITRLIAMRSIRILLPLLFGIFIIVPPQLYIEMTVNGDLQMSYWQFLKEFFSNNSNIFTQYQPGIWPHIDVNHLWFLRSLWEYSLVFILLLPILNSPWISKIVQWISNIPSTFAILLVVLPLFILQICWQEGETRYPIGFVFMLYGFLLGWNTVFWQRLKNKTRPLFIMSVTCFICFITFYNLVWINPEIKLADNEPRMLLGIFIYSLMRVLGVLTALAFAFNFLNNKSKALSYFSDAVYPFYILHQTIIIVAGYLLSHLALGAILEPILLLIITISACFIGFEIIKRVEILRPFFGLKFKNNYNRTTRIIGYICAFLLVMPIALEILI